MESFFRSKLYKMFIKFLSELSVKKSINFNELFCSNSKSSLKLIFLYLIFSYRVIKKVNFLNDDLYKLILIGCVSLILLQTFIHIGVNIRILPTTGMTLPFLSYGGSSLIGSSILAGMILNYTKNRIQNE